MNDLAPLLESSPSTNTRRLLAAGLADAPDPRALPRIAAALGVGLAGAAVALPAVASVPGAAVSGAVAVASKAPLAAATSAAVLSKWLVAGALGGVLVSGTVAVVEHVRVPVRSAALPSSVAPKSSSLREEPPRVRLNPMPEPPTAPAASAPSDAARAAAGVSAPPPSASNALGAEAARIDAARRALGRGDVDQTLRELDEYQRLRQVGVLDREARLLRIEALVQRGERARALTLTRSYLDAHPNDAHAARLRALIDNGGAAWPAAQGIER